ncbi:MAG: LAGLIDADG family homing endonuclease [bacterium]|nr:LAGLIDADG family homing endonuclease [bacterium]
MKANAVGKNFSEADLGYAAGFIDADGAIMACIEKHNEKKFGFRVRIIVKVSQKDTFVLKWFRKTFNTGNFRKNRTVNDWQIQDQKNCLKILEILLPYFKVKRRQAKLAISILKTSVESRKDLIHIANLADTLSRFNVRSKNRRKNHVSMIKEKFSSND